MLTVNSGGILSPGNSPGTLNAGATTWNGGGNFKFEINNAAPGGVGTQWDLLNITGGLQINATGGSPFGINVTSSPSPTRRASRRTSIPRQTTPSPSSRPQPVSAISMQMNSRSTRAVLEFLHRHVSINQSGNNLTLDYAGVSAVPEPSTYAAIAGATMLGFAAWRRRKANA